MATIQQVAELLEDVKSLKHKFVCAQMYQNAACLRDIEKQLSEIEIDLEKIDNK